METTSALPKYHEYQVCSVFLLTTSPLPFSCLRSTLLLTCCCSFLLTPRTSPAPLLHQPRTAGTGRWCSPFGHWSRFTCLRLSLRWTTRRHRPQSRASCTYTWWRCVRRLSCLVYVPCYACVFPYGWHVLHKCVPCTIGVTCKTVVFDV